MKYKLHRTMSTLNCHNLLFISPFRNVNSRYKKFTIIANYIHMCCIVPISC